MTPVTNHASSIDQSTELYVKEVLAGDIESVRRSLIEAMETVGYDIIEDEPNIIGRRGATGWGRSCASANILDYARSLTIRLKQIGESSTRVTFDYTIGHGMLSKGEHSVVVQEARTIAAISKNHAIENTCSFCETESTDDSRFCRTCGAPLTSEQTELEVLRMMAEVRAGKISVVTSSIISLSSAISLAVLFLLSNAALIKPKLFVVLVVFSIVSIFGSSVASFFGWNRLKRALEKPVTPPQQTPRYMPSSNDTIKTPALPPQRQAPASVTEGTTNLLDDNSVSRSEHEKVPVSRRRTTNELD